jgi:hypothetical protein
MAHGKKSRKLLLITTVLTIVALASVLFVYAAVTLFTVTGGNVTVLGVTTGTIEYATTNTGTPTWITPLQISSGAWYAEIVISSSSTYHGPVTITWQLQTDVSGSWVNDANIGSSVTTTGVSLAGGSQTIYASTDDTLPNAINWGSVDSTPGTYQIIATVASAPSS